MQLRDLNEARRNPDVNTGGRPVDTFDELAKYYGNREYFINFSNVPKLGVNPKSVYNTPLGVYSYPMGTRATADAYQKDNIPFAGNRDYVHLMKSSEAPIELSRGGDWESLMTTFWDANFSSLRFSDPEYAKEREDLLFNDIMNYATASAMVDSNGGIFWNFTFIIANMLCSEEELVSKKILLDTDHYMSDFSYIDPSKERKHSAVWSRAFLRAGMNSFVDYGDGIIHRNEKYQAVFLNTKSFTLVNRLSNPRAGGSKVYMINDAHSARKFLGKISNASDSAKRQVILDLAIKGINITDRTYDDYEVYVSSSPKYTLRYRIAPNIFLPSLAVVLTNAIKNLDGAQALSLSENLIIALYHEISWHFHDETEIRPTLYSKVLVQLIDACFHGDDKEFTAHLMDMFEKGGGMKYYAGFEQTHL